MLPYFKRAEHNERGADAWHGTGGPLNVMDLRSPHRFGRVFVEAGKQAGYPHNPDFNGADPGRRRPLPGDAQERRALQRRQGLPDAEPRRGPTCTVITGAHATRILLDGRRAIGVEVAGRRRAAAAARRAREVLLCAGALQSPQLLMLSGIGPADAPARHRHRRCATTCPASARNLHDHVDVVQVVDAPQLKDLFGLSLAGAVNVAARASSSGAGSAAAC